MNLPAPRESLALSRHAEDLFAGVLLFLALGLLNLVSEQFLITGPLLAGALAYPFLKERLSFELSLIGYLMLALPIALLLQNHEVKGLGGTPFQNSFYLATYCSLLAVAKLYSRAPSRLPRILLFTTLVIVACAPGLPSWLRGDVKVYFQHLGNTPGKRFPGAHLIYIGFSLVFGLVALGVLRASLRRPQQVERRPRWVRGAVALAFCGVLLTTTGGVLGVRATYQDASKLYLRLTRKLRPGSGRGFSDLARLGSVQGLHDPDSGREIALRVFAPRSPGYLRGRAFEDYEAGDWKIDERPSEPEEVEQEQVDLPGRKPPAAEEEPDMRVHPTGGYERVYFSPLHSSRLNTHVARIRRYAGSVIRPVDQSLARGFGVYVDHSPLHSGAGRASYRKLPEDEALLGALQALAAKLRLQELPLPQRVAAIRNHFAHNYEYKFGIQFKADVDPLLQFLTEKSHGHCELFASAGALLLRVSGARARYVTGFLCSERNVHDEELWLARNRSAHAWVELYDPQRGWETVEFTPPAGMPPTQPSTGSESWQEWLRGKWEAFLGYFRGGLSSAPQALLKLFAALGTWLLGAWWRSALLVALVAAFYWRRRARGQEGTAEAFLGDLPPELAAERERFLALEAQLREQRLGREAAETLLEYARRLEGAEEWPQALERAETLAFLREFAVARYRVRAAAAPA